MHPSLAAIFYWTAHRLFDVVVTSAYRANDPGVHGTLPRYRGLDIRSYIYADPQGMADMINANWVYDVGNPTRKPVALYHEVIDKKTEKSKGVHIHLQCHVSNTEQINTQNS